MQVSKHDNEYLMAENLSVILVFPSNNIGVNTLQHDGSLPRSMIATVAITFAATKRVEASLQHFGSKGISTSLETIHCCRRCISSLDKKSHTNLLVSVSSSFKCMLCRVSSSPSNDADTKIVIYAAHSFKKESLCVAVSVQLVSFVGELNASLNTSRTSIILFLS